MMNAIEKGMSSRLGPLADEFIKLYESPDPENIYTYSPGLCRTRNGRLIATMDVGGPGVENIPGAKCKRDKSSRDFQGKCSPRTIEEKPGFIALISRSCMQDRLKQAGPSTSWATAGIWRSSVRTIEA